MEAVFELLLIIINTIYELFILCVTHLKQPVLFIFSRSNRAARLLKWKTSKLKMLNDIVAGLCILLLSILFIWLIIYIVRCST